MHQGEDANKFWVIHHIDCIEVHPGREEKWNRQRMQGPNKPMDENRVDYKTLVCRYQQQREDDVQRIVMVNSEKNLLPLSLRKSGNLRTSMRIESIRMLESRATVT